MKNFLQPFLEQGEVSLLMLATFLVGWIVFILTYRKWKPKADKVGSSVWGIKEVQFASAALIGTTAFWIWMLLWILGYVS